MIVPVMLALMSVTLSKAPSAADPLILPAPKSAAQLCRPETLRTGATGSSSVERLGDLPPGRVEFAVWRRVGGCTVSEVMFEGRHVFVLPEATTREPSVSAATLGK